VKIQFIGQDGKIVGSSEATCKAIYPLKRNDTFIRTSAVFTDSAKIYLNPVFRYSSYPFAHRGGYTINKTKTTFMRFVGILILVGWVLVFIRFYIRSKEQLDDAFDPLIGEAEEPVFVRL